MQQSRKTSSWAANVAQLSASQVWPMQRWLAHGVAGVAPGRGDRRRKAGFKPHPMSGMAFHIHGGIPLNRNISAMSFESLETCSSTLSPINLPDLSFIRPAVRAKSYCLFTKIVSFPVAYPAVV